MMKRLLLVLWVLLMVGCGTATVDVSSVYDTESNPADFPDEACELLVQIESGQLATYDLITDAFDRLYTEHPDMLDNKEWRGVIGDLGPRFVQQADDMVERGVNFYTQAAGFYMLAAFANPDDAGLSRRALLFDAWSRGIRHLSVTGLERNAHQTLEGTVRITRYMVLGDSLQNKFAQQYLVGDHLKKMLAQSPSPQLTVADQAFLSSLGLQDPPSQLPLAAFDEPPIELITARAAPLANRNLRLELYFLTVATPTTDYRFALRGADVEGEIALIEAAGPITDWPTGKVTVVTADLNYLDPQGGLALAISSSSSDTELLVPRGLSDPWVPLPDLLPSAEKP